MAVHTIVALLESRFAGRHSSPFQFALERPGLGLLYSIGRLVAVTRTESINQSGRALCLSDGIPRVNVPSDDISEASDHHQRIVVDENCSGNPRDVALAGHGGGGGTGDTPRALRG